VVRSKRDDIERSAEGGDEDGFGQATLAPFVIVRNLEQKRSVILGLAAVF